MSETTPAPLPGSPEHATAMAAQFDEAQAKAATEAAASATTNAPVKPVRPDNVPEKFWDAEKGAVRMDELLKSYGELETGKSKPATATPAGTEPTPPAPADAGKAALEEVGLSYEKFAKEFAETGKLSEASYTEMAAKNIPRAVVDHYVAGRVQAAEGEAKAIREEVFGVVGGEQKYGELVSWMKDNMARDELVAFNSVVDGRDTGQIKLAVAGALAKFQAANGSEPKLLSGDGRPTASDVFRSTHELTTAMRDKRYERDPAYRADVEAKLRRSGNVF